MTLVQGNTMETRALVKCSHKACAVGAGNDGLAMVLLSSTTLTGNSSVRRALIQNIKRARSIYLSNRTFNGYLCCRTGSQIFMYFLAGNLNGKQVRAVRHDKQRQWHAFASLRRLTCLQPLRS